jgi:predicted O-linked N-acetylglucosamine transferase (SPINDLY family)
MLRSSLLVITKVGNHLASRVSVSTLLAAELPEFVALEIHLAQNLDTPVNLR